MGCLCRKIQGQQQRHHLLQNIFPETARVRLWPHQLFKAGKQPAFLPVGNTVIINGIGKPFCPHNVVHPVLVTEFFTFSFPADLLPVIRVNADTMQLFPGDALPDRCFYRLPDMPLPYFKQRVIAAGGGQQ